MSVKQSFSDTSLNKVVREHCQKGIEKDTSDTEEKKIWLGPRKTAVCGWEVQSKGVPVWMIRIKTREYDLPNSRELADPERALR